MKILIGTLVLALALIPSSVNGYYQTCPGCQLVSGTQAESDSCVTFAITSSHTASGLCTLGGEVCVMDFGCHADLYGYAWVNPGCPGELCIDLSNATNPPPWTPRSQACATSFSVISYNETIDCGKAKKWELWYKVPGQTDKIIYRLVSTCASCSQ